VFTKSNRLTLMWGMPFGVALTVFAADLVHFGIGDQWKEAIILLQVFGLTAAFNHIGFNWTAFYRAVGETRPIATVVAATMIAFCITAIPLLILFELPGFGAGMAMMTDWRCGHTMSRDSSRDSVSSPTSYGRSRRPSLRCSQCSRFAA